MTDLQALYAGICAQPDEDTPRLALADFLDEQGGKENAFRADFIRTHVQLAREEPWSEPWRELNKRWDGLRSTAEGLAAEHKLPWVLHLKGRIRAFYFERGLVGQLTLFSKRFVSEGESYFEQDPIRGVKFVKLDSTMGTVKPDVLFKCPYLARLAKLDLDGSSLKDADLATMAASPHLKKLRSLSLSGYQRYTSAALPKLLKALPALTELNLSGNWQFGDKHLTELVKCKEVSRLSVLNVEFGNAKAKGIAALLASKNIAGLTALSTGASAAYDEEHGYTLTPRAGTTDGLKVAEAVAASPSLGKVQELDLRYRAIGNEGLKLIADAAKALPSLRRLNLEGCALSITGVKALAASEIGKRLLYLDLRSNPNLTRSRKQLAKMFPAAYVEEPVPYEFE